MSASWISETLFIFAAKQLYNYKLTRNLHKNYLVDFLTVTKIFIKFAVVIAKADFTDMFYLKRVFKNKKNNNKTNISLAYIGFVI
jgi:hypothetical protein